MNTLRTGGIAALVAVCSFTVELVRLVSNVGPRSVPGWFPEVGATGGTATIYFSLVSLVVAVVTAAVAVGAGIAMARRVDLRREYRPFLGSVAVGVLVGVLVPSVLSWVVLSSPMETTLRTAGDLVPVVVTRVASLVGVAASRGLQLVALIFAGAAFAQFRDETGTASQLTDEPSVSASDD